MPKLENFTDHIKINGNTYARNAVNYQVQNGDQVGIYYSKDRDQRILRGTLARFDKWTDLNDDQYTSFTDLTNDLDAFLFSYSGEDYFLDIAKGNIEGVSGFGFAGIDDNLGASEKTVGGFTSGRYAFQTTSVAMEIVSGSSDDNASGTGARTAIVRTLDANYLMVNKTISLNGTTPVAIGNNFRINQSEVLTVGSGGKNAGKITTRVVSGAVEQSIIAIGANVSQDAVITSPAGFTAFLWTSVGFSDKGQDARIRVYRRSFGGVFILRASLPTYQSQFNRNFKIPLRINEKTDLETTGTSTNEGTSVQVGQQFELEDNSIVEMSSTTFKLITE